MKRIVLIVVLSVAGLIVCLGSTLLLITKLNTVHQYILSRVNRSLPGTFTLGTLHLSPLCLRLEITDFAVADSSGIKLAGFDRVLLDVSTLALLHKKIVVKNALLEHPWARLEVDSTGHLLLLDAFSSPKPAPSDTSTSHHAPAPFSIELKSLNIIGGVVQMAAAKDSLALQVNGFSMTARGAWDTASITANVAISLDSASLQRTGSHLQLFDLAFLARLHNQVIDTVTLKLRTAESSISLHGSGEPLASDPSVDLTIAADVALSELRTALGMDIPFHGTSRLYLHLSGKPSNPEGDITVSCRKSNFGGYLVDSASLTTHLKNRVLTLTPLYAKTLDGTVSITGDVDARSMFPGGFLTAPSSVQKLRYTLSLSGTDVPLNNFASALSGRATVALGVEGQGVHPDSLSAATTISAQVTALKIAATSKPLDGAITCTASVKLGTALVNSLSGTLGSTAIGLAGSYGIRSGAMEGTLDIAAPSLDTLLDFAGIGSAKGSAVASAHFRGDVQHPEVAVSIAADSISIRQQRIGSVTLDGVLARNGIATINSVALTNRFSHLQANGAATLLKNGRFLPADQITFEGAISSSGLSLPDFIDSLEGIVSLNATVKGSAGDLHGNIRLTAKGVTFDRWRIAQIDLKADLDGGRVTILPLAVAVEHNQNLTITGWAALKDSFDIALSAPRIELHSLSGIAVPDSLDGAVSVDLHANGTYKNPDVQGTVGINGISIAKMHFDPVALQLDMHNHEIAVNGRVGGDLQAGYNLVSKAFSANLNFDTLALAPYLALSGQNIDGTITAAVSASGNTDSITAVSATLNIYDLVLSLNGLRVIETHELNATLNHGQYTIPGFSISLAGEGALKGYANGRLQGPHDAAVNGSIPLTIVRHFAPDLGDVDGSIAIDAFFKGTAKDPDMNAEIQLQNIGMVLPGLSQRLHHLNGQIRANPKSIRIDSLKGNIDDGSLSMNGRVRLQEMVPVSLRADITLESVPLGIPDLLDVVLDAKLQIAGTPDTSEVSGDVVIVDGLYYRDIAVNLNPFTGMGERKRKEIAPLRENGTPFLKTVNFDVGVQARTPLRADNNMVQLTIAPDLHLMGSLQAPALGGRAKVEQGTITYLRKVFTVDQGVIDFVNPYAIEPKIDIKGSIPIGLRSDTIYIAISGSPDDLQFKLSCNDPRLEDQDILSLLILGKTTAEFQNTILSGSVGESPQQMLATLVASTLGDDIKKATGLDMLEIETGSADRDTSDRIAVTIGKQLTRNLGTKYTVESEEGEIVQRATAEYRIMQNLYLTGFQDTKRVYGGELRFTWEKR